MCCNKLRDIIAFSSQDGDGLLDSALAVVEMVNVAIGEVATISSDAAGSDGCAVFHDGFIYWVAGAVEGGVDNDAVRRIAGKYNYLLQLSFPDINGVLCTVVQL